MQEARDLQDHAVQGRQGLDCRAGCAAAILWNQCCCHACQLAASRGGVLALVPVSGAALAESFRLPSERTGWTLGSSSPSIARSLPPSSLPVSQQPGPVTAFGPAAAALGGTVAAADPVWPARRPYRCGRQSPRPQLLQHTAPQQSPAVLCQPVPETTAGRRRRRPCLTLTGKRRYDRKQAGFGGQTKPVFHKKVGLCPSWLLLSPRRRLGSAACAARGVRLGWVACRSSTHAKAL